MKLRKSDAREIINALIIFKKIDFPIDINALEALHLAGGNLENISHGAAVANKYGIQISFEALSKYDLEGKNIRETIGKLYSRAKSV